MTATVLVVDDSVRVRPLVVRILRDAGYAVLEAGSAGSALELVTESVDLLLTDIVLAGMSGIELAERAVIRRPGLPVLYMSGFNVEPPDGMDFIGKPFRPEELIARVETALRRQSGTA